jgi:hypothetical protein
MHNEESSADIVQKIAALINDMGSGRIPITRETLAECFDPDVTSMIDNEIMAVGIEGFYCRLLEMREKVQYWESMPPDISLSEGDKAAARYKYRFVDHEGNEGIIDIIAIWTLRKRRLYRMIENTHRSGASISLRPHEKEASDA